MTLLLEDGTGISDADAYVDVVDVDSYATNYGKTGWSVLATPEKEVHIRRATQFIDNKYPFPGVPLTSTQGLFFPVQELRIRGHSVEGLPRQLLDAVCELSIISVTTDLVNSVASRAYTYRKVEVGDVKKTERFESENNQSVFRSVELLLSPILGGVASSGISYNRMVRV